MKKKTVLVLLCLILSLSACGKEAGVSDQEGSYLIGDCLYLEDGLVVGLMLGNTVYYEYETGTYMPLCARANCLHNTDDCMAVRFSEVTGLGKIGNTWYYLKNEAEGRSFYRADLDGQNEKKIVLVEPYGDDDYMYHVEPCVYYDNSCIYAMSKSTFYEIDEHATTSKDHMNTIRRYDFDTNKEEILCPELFNESYLIYGRYQNQLIYVEARHDGGVLKSLNLQTGEEKTLCGKDSGFSTGILSENDVVYMSRMDDTEGYRIMELDLETGEQKEIWEHKGEAGDVYPLFAWGEEMKAFSIPRSEDDYRATYLYQMDGTCKLIREEKYDPYYNFLAVKNGKVIVEFFYGMNDYLATMSIEDFTAGKDNWKRLEY